MDNTATKTQIEVVDLSQLGQGLFTETVEIDPNVDTNAPSRPIDEALFDEKTGRELGKIVYVANITAPGPNATDFDGDPRPFISRLSGIIGKGERTGDPWNALKLNFDLKVVGFQQNDVDVTTLQGRAGKSLEASATSFTKKREGQPYTEISDLANKLGLFNNLTLGEGQKTLNLDQDQWVALVANAIASGQHQIGVTVRWVAGWINGAAKPDGTTEKGKYTFAGQYKFPVGKDGKRSPVVSVDGREVIARVKLVNLVKL